ncbi:hypothetical protein [Rathayibacter soli]|uniref:hypothetical protein n=1 Tax=Rathayibacter soli TaxID=3144168 RepID=UPI0027E3C23B|nr:hypothetical protein [Glaciibacter superstes]
MSALAGAMRSEWSMPDSRWPHGMVIEIDNHDHRICELLWARDSYHIAQGSDDLPPALWPEPTMPPENHPAAALRRSWAPVWRRLWAAALAWYATRDGDVNLASHALAADEHTEFEQLARALDPPSWFDAVGTDNFDTLAFARWDEDSVNLLLSAHEIGEPEDAVLDSVVAAWRRGLARIVEIPTIGEYTRVLSENTLLVTAATRSNPGAYDRALNAFCARP